MEILLECLLVNKAWHELGNDERLNYISNRKVLEVPKEVDSSGWRKLIVWILYDRNLLKYLRYKKTEGLLILLKDTIFIFSDLSLLSSLVISLCFEYETAIPLLLGMSCLILNRLHTVSHKNDFLKYKSQNFLFFLNMTLKEKIEPSICFSHSPFALQKYFYAPIIYIQS